MKASNWIDDATKDLPALVTADEAAAALRCSKRSLARRIATGRIAAVRHDAGSSRVLIPRASLRAYLEGLDAR